MKKQEIIEYVFVFIGFFFLTMPLWFKVDTLSLRMWDESRNAVNALEMYHSGNYLIRTFDGLPETYNLKPPLLTWFQVLSFNLVGVNELGVRLPSIVFSIFTMFVVFHFIKRVTNNNAFALLGVGITSTSFGFFGDHVGRYGDHEAMLVFFFTLFAYLVYRFIETKNNRLVLFMMITVSLGILTKSIAILTILPGAFLIILRRKRLIKTVWNRHFLYGIGFFVCTVVLYYFVRFLSQPDYLYMVWHGELFPRYLNTSEIHAFNESDTFYYVRQLISGQISYWYLFIPLSLVALLLGSNKQRGVMFDLLIMASTFIGIISYGTTNFWYLAPVLPLIAIIIALSIYVIYARFVKMPQTIEMAFVICLIAYPFYGAYTTVIGTGDSNYDLEENGISYFLKDDNNFQYLNNRVHILLDDHFGLEPHLFYQKNLNYLYGIELTKIDKTEIAIGDTILLSHISALEYVKTNFKFETIVKQNETTHLVEILP